MATVSRMMNFIGGPLHEHSQLVEEFGGVVPIVYVHPLPTHSGLYQKYHQRYAHYQLSDFKVGKGKNAKMISAYYLAGYSKDRKKLSVLPGC